MDGRNPFRTTKSKYGMTDSPGKKRTTSGFIQGFLGGEKWKSSTQSRDGHIHPSTPEQLLGFGSSECFKHTKCGFSQPSLNLEIQDDHLLGPKVITFGVHQTWSCQKGESKRSALGKRVLCELQGSRVRIFRPTSNHKAKPDHFNQSGKITLLRCCLLWNPMRLFSMGSLTTTSKMTASIKLKG